MDKPVSIKKGGFKEADAEQKMRKLEEEMVRIVCTLLCLINVYLMSVNVSLVSVLIYPGVIFGCSCKGMMNYTDIVKQIIRKDFH